MRVNWTTFCSISYNLSFILIEEMSKLTIEKLYFLPMKIHRHITFLVSLFFFSCARLFSDAEKMVGVYWGAFDPPTIAHEAIISAAKDIIRLEKIIVVVNNHHYKNYTYPLETRLEMMRKILDSKGLTNAELLWQDDQQKIDYTTLRNMTDAPICAIAGYDAYLSWINHSSIEERCLYESIAVIPRGGETPLLYDANAFLVTIGEDYQYVSSTKVREAATKVN